MRAPSLGRRRRRRGAAARRARGGSPGGAARASSRLAAALTKIGIAAAGWGARRTRRRRLPRGRSPAPRRPAARARRVRAPAHPPPALPCLDMSGEARAGIAPRRRGQGTGTDPRSRPRRAAQGWESCCAATPGSLGGRGVPRDLTTSHWAGFQRSALKCLIRNSHARGEAGPPPWGRAPLEFAT